MRHLHLFLFFFSAWGEHTLTRDATNLKHYAHLVEALGNGTYIPTWKSEVFLRFMYTTASESSALTTEGAVESSSPTDGGSNKVCFALESAYTPKPPPMDCLAVHDLDKIDGPVFSIVDLQPGHWYKLTIWMTDSTGTTISIPHVYDYFAAFSKEHPYGNDKELLLANARSGNGGVYASPSTCTNDVCEGDSSELRQQFFDQIYRDDIWVRGNRQGTASSGYGSSDTLTGNIIQALQEVIQTRHITSILDVPCGDLAWIKKVDLEGVKYVGGDISTIVIERNEKTFAERGWQFQIVDVVNPFNAKGYDLVIIRDLMYHLRPAENMKVLTNIDTCGAKYVMLSTYVALDENLDDYHLVVGHKINLFHEPYCIRSPNRMYIDGKEDLFMGLWVIDPKVPLMQSCDTTKRGIEWRVNP